MTDHENENQEQSTTARELITSVRDLIEMMNKGGIGELDLKTEDFKIRLRSEDVALASATPVMAMPQTFAMPQGAPSAPAAAASADAPAATPEAKTPDGHVVTSPMIGTFYSASAPGEPDYVQIGDEVETGQVIGIIEAMKIMNEITADKSGVVVELMVENAQPVEYGSPLVRISSSVALD